MAKDSPNNIHTTIKFDGSALTNRAMDVAHLAPSLLALSDLVKQANRYANGERAGVRVFVNADLKQKCFELNVELALTIWEHAKLLIADDQVRTAKEIAEWLGIMSGSTIGLFMVIKKIRGQKIETVTALKSADGKDMIEIKIEGDSEPIEIVRPVYELYSSSKTREKALAVLEPLREDGYDTLEFYKDDMVFVNFTKDDIAKADGSDLPEVVAQNVHTSIIHTTVRIRKAAYEGKSRWTVMYQRAVEAAIDDEAWLNKFQNGEEKAPPGSSLEVDLEEQYLTDENSEIIGEPTYRIKKIHNVILPTIQRNLRFQLKGRDLI